MRVVAAVALGVLLQACRSAPETRPATAAFDEAYAAMRAGRPLDALPLYEKAIALEPDHEGAWIEYAICLRRVGRLPAAARAGWRALELGSPSAGKWSNQGNVFMQAEAFDAARAAYEEAARLADDRAWAARNFLNLGYREWVAHLPKDAARDYRRAAQLDPSPLVSVDLAMLAASDPDAAVRARGRATLEDLRGKVEKDRQLAEYVDQALRELADRDRLRTPVLGEGSQELPRELLARPAPGNAARLPLPARGWRTWRLEEDLTVRLEVPEPWCEELKQEGAGAATVRFRPTTGTHRWLLATFIGHPAKSESPEKVRSFVEDQLRRVQPAAAGGRGTVMDVSTSAAPGFAFSAVDGEALKHPTFDDVPYLTQGRIAGRRADVVFSFFALEDSAPERKEALDAVRSVREGTR